MITNSGIIIKKLVILFLVIAGAYFGREFFIPLVLGGLFATVFLPVCKWLESHRVPTGIACFICVLILLLLMAGVGGMLSWQVNELSAQADQIKERIVDMVNQTQQFIYNQLGISRQQQVAILKQEQSEVTKGITMAAGSFFIIVINLIFVLAYIFLLLYYRKHIKTFMLKLVAAPQRPEAEKVIFNAANVSEQYLIGLFKMIVCLWVMYSIGFAIVGVQNPIFFAVLCGLLELIPFVGNITGTGITVLVSLARGGDASMIIGIVITYGIVQFIQGWVLEPLIVGPQVRINPLATVIALILGEMIWGIPGIMLAIPLTGMLKIVCDHIEPLKPYGYLIGETDEPSAFTEKMEKVKEWFRKKLGRK